MTDKRGTGEELGRIPLGEIGELVIVDDGHPDPDVRTRVDRTPGEPGNLQTVASAFGCVRRDCDSDAEFIDWIDEIDPTDSGTPGSPTPRAFGGSSVMFKCPGCNRSFPRTQNENPGDGPDRCPDCAEDEA